MNFATVNFATVREPTRPGVTTSYDGPVAVVTLTGRGIDG